MLTESTGVVVLVGDEFLQRLNRNSATGCDSPDPMVWEIAAAIRMGKPIYPVLIGSLDMPLAAQLPRDIQAFAEYQAVFAREPSFDVAMEVMVQAMQAAHGIETMGNASDAEVAQEPFGHAEILRASLVFFAGLLAACVVGRLIIFVGRFDVLDENLMVASLWMGLKYLLLTALIGLAPYTSYWLVAVLRARARLPVRNVAGLIGVFNTTGSVIASGIFLMLSSIPGWRLRPLFIFPSNPSLWHYFGLAVGLFFVVIVASAVVLLEPKIRRLRSAWRDVMLNVFNWLGGLLALTVVWLLASLFSSFPSQEKIDEIAWLGYFSLTPTLLVIYAYGWKFGSKQLMGAARSWEWRYLFVVSLGFYFLATLSLYSIGVGRVFASAEVKSSGVKP